MRILDGAHKAIRNALSQFSLLAGKTDFSSRKQLNELKNNWHELLRLLDHHEHVEEKLLYPLVEPKLPGILQRQKEQHKLLQSRLTALNKRVDSLPLGENEVPGYEFYLNFSEFHSMYLQHINKEEKDLEEVLGSLDESDKLHDKVLQGIGDVPEDIMLSMMKYGMPSYSPQLRMNLLKRVKKVAPSGFVNQVMRLVAPYLSVMEMQKLERYCR